MKSCNAVTFVLLRPDGKILMQKRDDGRRVYVPYPNMWSIPGGAIEEGETPIRAVAREIEEEYGLKIASSQCQSPLTYEHDGDTSDQVFICEVDKSTKPIMHEGSAMEWMTIDEIKRLTLAWEQSKILSKLEGLVAR